MKTPDPARFSSRHKPDEMKMSGFSSTFSEDRPANRKSRKTTSKPITKSQTSEVPHSRTPVVRKSRSTALPQLRSYELRNFRKWHRLDIRFTREQKKFLQDFEDKISDDRPELQKENPQDKRVTKASIVRALVEIFRQLDINIDAQNIHNETDLLQPIYKKIIDRVRKSRSTGVRK